MDRDETALIESMARAMFERPSGYHWDKTSSAVKDEFRNDARAALSVVRRSEQ